MGRKNGILHVEDGKKPGQVKVMTCPDFFCPEEKPHFK